SYPVLSCPVLSCPVLSCPVLSCPVLSCPHTHTYTHTYTNTHTHTHTHTHTQTFMEHLLLAVSIVLLNQPWLDSTLSYGGTCFCCRVALLNAQTAVGCFHLALNVVICSMWLSTS